MREAKDFSSGERRSSWMCGGLLSSLQKLENCMELKFHILRVELTNESERESQELYELFNQKLIFLNKSRLSRQFREISAEGLQKSD